MDTYKGTNIIEDDFQLFPVFLEHCLVVSLRKWMA